LYLVIPVDLIPDFLGLPGRFDDLLVALGTLYLLLGKSREIPGESGSRQSRSSDPSSRGAQAGPSDPYEVLEVERDQGLEEIRRQYKEKLLQYHPDRVLHLGREFQEMAERKTKEITEAFRKILRERENKP
jgi:hypothetical protein